MGNAFACWYCGQVQANFDQTMDTQHSPYYRMSNNHNIMPHSVNPQTIYLQSHKWLYLLKLQLFSPVQGVQVKKEDDVYSHLIKLENIKQSMLYNNIYDKYKVIV